MWCNQHNLQFMFWQWLTNLHHSYLNKTDLLCNKSPWNSSELSLARILHLWWSSADLCQSADRPLVAQTTSGKSGVLVRFTKLSFKGQILKNWIRNAWKALGKYHRCTEPLKEPNIHQQKKRKTPTYEIHKPLLEIHYISVTWTHFTNIMDSHEQF